MSNICRTSLILGKRRCPAHNQRLCSTRKHRLPVQVMHGSNSNASPRTGEMRQDEPNMTYTLEDKFTPGRQTTKLWHSSHLDNENRMDETDCERRPVRLYVGCMSLYIASLMPPSLIETKPRYAPNEMLKASQHLGCCSPKACCLMLLQYRERHL
jgi:hypothetical protein